MNGLQSGFNGLELSASVALIGLLATLATPAWNGYTERTRINRAIGEISRVSIELSRWSDRNSDGAPPASLHEAGIAMGPDPWGNPYTYTRVHGAAPSSLRKDERLNPVNTDFDLYSNGPDGGTSGNFTASEARDDIVRANDGAFVGVVEDF